MIISWNDYVGSSDADADADASASSAPERIVWHYTSAAVFEQIVANHVIWATDIGRLNDTDEIRLGIKRFKKRMASVAKPSFSFKDQDAAVDYSPILELIDDWEDYPFVGSAFAISFSRYGDDNSQWERYADSGGGVAVGIRRGSHMPVLGTDPAKLGSFRVVEDIPMYWTKMRYKRRAQDLAIDRATNEMLDGMSRNPHPEPDVDMSQLIQDQALSEYSRAAASIKNAGFRAEQEVRYVISRPTNGDAIHARANPHDPARPIPYVKVTGSPPEVTADIDPRRLPQYQERPLLLPIEKVRLGPRNTRSIQSVMDLLRDHGYDKKVRVIKSKSTLR